MEHFLGLIGDPYFWGLIFSYWIFNNAVEALPAPHETSNPFYAWFYKFANGLAGNMREAFASKLPGGDK